MSTKHKKSIDFILNTPYKFAWTRFDAQLITSTSFPAQHGKGAWSCTYTQWYTEQYLTSILILCASLCYKGLDTNVRIPNLNALGRPTCSTRSTVYELAVGSAPWIGFVSSCWSLGVIHNPSHKDMWPHAMYLLRHFGWPLAGGENRSSDSVSTFSWKWEERLVILNIIRENIYPVRGSQTAAAGSCRLQLDSACNSSCWRFLLAGPLKADREARHPCHWCRFVNILRKFQGQLRLVARYFNGQLWQVILWINAKGAKLPYLTDKAFESVSLIRWRSWNTAPDNQFAPARSKQ